MARHAQLVALASELRPELHRYCARLMGSVIDGEDVVQDTFARALVALHELEEDAPLRAWLFRIAHNRALDLLRSRAIRAAEPIEAAHEVADPDSPDPVEVMMRREAVETAVSRFTELPTTQRSVVILKDVLDQSLEEIAAMLDLTVNAVKAHLARGRARLKAVNAEAQAKPAPRAPSSDVARYVALFNGRDWDGLRAMLADDVHLIQSTHPLRAGAVARGLDVRRQHQFGVVDDVADITVVADEADAAVLPVQPHQVAGLHCQRILPDRDHLAALEPGGREPHAIDLGVDAEEHADVGGTGALRVRRLDQVHVVGQHRAQPVPVAPVEQRDIAGHV